MEEVTPALPVLVATQRPSLRTSLPVSVAPPSHPGVRYPHVASWLAVIVGMYCLHSARPMKHSIDSFFGVARSFRWNESVLNVSLALCFAAFVFALVAATVRLLEPRNKHWSPPYGPFVASGLALVTLVVGILRL